jgi:flagellin-like protein
MQNRGILSKRAVSAVVATVLIVMITVVAAGIV